MNNERLRAFTLIELLVVIAIISILAAIIFPVFAQAMEKGRTAVCQSNLRQIGFAMVQYTSDNDETMPLIGSQGVECWLNSLTPYYGGSSPQTEADNSTNGSGAVWCPDDPHPDMDKAGTFDVTPDGTITSMSPPPYCKHGDNGCAYFFWERNSSYAMNKMVVSGEGGIPTISAYTSPAQTIAVAETSYDFYGDYFAPDEYGLAPDGPVSLADPQKPGDINDTDFDASFPAWNGADAPVTLESGYVHEAHEPFDINPTCHHSGTNYLYADGHVKWQTWSAVWLQNGKPFGASCQGSFDTDPVGTPVRTGDPGPGTYDDGNDVPAPLQTPGVCPNTH